MDSVAPEGTFGADEFGTGSGASSGGAAVADGGCRERAAAAGTDEGSPRHAGDCRRSDAAPQSVRVRGGGALRHGSHQ